MISLSNRVATAACAALSLSIVMLPACSSGSSDVAPATVGQRLDQDNAVNAALAGFQQNASAARFFDSANAWAIFPKVTKGAAGIGIASGRGQVFQSGTLIGFAKLTSVTVGPQLGGQSFSEIIFFENQFALNKFMANQFTGHASTAAVAGKKGDTAVAAYSDGVAIFTRAQDGLILAADLGGQQFDYIPTR